jgi:glutamate--cysteine ligase
VQVNFDWSSERDLLRKTVVALKLTPIVHALFANAPFKEGEHAGKLSERGDVWLRMDPARSGLIESLWARRPLGYDDYVEWALDAGMFLFWRGSSPIKNTGQTFRAFMRDGFDGYQATEEDWRLHLTTLFPEVRLKGTLEIRPCDALPPALSLAALALWTGLLYDEQALTLAEDLCAHWEFQQVNEARPRLVRDGLAAPFLGAPSGWQLAERLLELAAAGLVQRGRAGAGQASERNYLLPAFKLVEARTSPAAQAIERAERTGSLIEATRNDRDDAAQG